jgi:hypothetical protein
MRHEPLPPPIALCAVHRRSQWQEARQLGGVDFVLPSSRPPAADMRPLSTAPGACDDTDEQSEHGDQPCRKTHLSAEKSGKNSTRKNSRNKTGEEDREVVLSQDPPPVIAWRDLPPALPPAVTLTSIQSPGDSLRTPVCDTDGTREERPINTTA